MVRVLAILVASLILTTLLGSFLLITRYPPGWRDLRPGMTLREVGRLTGVAGLPAHGPAHVTRRHQSPLVRHELSLDFDLNGRLTNVRIRRIIWPFQNARWRSVATLVLCGRERLQAY